eukprot:1556379-Rhodomonas_salina.3
MLVGCENVLLQQKTVGVPFPVLIQTGDTMRSENPVLPLVRAAKTSVLTRGMVLRQEIVRVACGALHSLAVDADGGVWSWGGMSRGQLGHGNLGKPFLSNPRQVAALRSDLVSHVGAGSTKLAMVILRYGSVLMERSVSSVCQTEFGNAWGVGGGSGVWGLPQYVFDQCGSDLHVGLGGVWVSRRRGYHIRRMFAEYPSGKPPICLCRMVVFPSLY